MHILRGAAKCTAKTKWYYLASMHSGTRARAGLAPRNAKHILTSRLQPWNCLWCPRKQKIETQGVLGKARAIPQRSGALILGSRVHTKFFSTSAPIFDNFFKNQCRPGSTTPFWYHQCPPTTPPDAHVSLKSATLVLGGLQPRGQDQCIWPPSIDRSDVCVVLFFGDLSEGMWTVCVHLCAHLRSQNVCWPNRTTPFWYRQCLFQHPTGCIHYKGQHYCLVGCSLRVRTSALEPHRWEILSAQWCS